MGSKITGTDNFNTALITSVALLADVKPSDTDGGANVAGTQVRDLNTELSDDQDIMTIGPGNGEFTLGAGRYLIEWSAPAFECGKHKASLYSSLGLVMEGSSEYSQDSGDYAQTTSKGAAVVDVDTQETFYIEHYTQIIRNPNGLGVGSYSGNNEVYTRVKVQKIAN